MKLVKRKIEPIIKSHIGKNKAILITGSRRVGKTVLIHSIAESYNQQVLTLNGEDFDVQELLQKRSAANYELLVAKAKLVMIDEAQVVKNIGQILKLMIDSLPEITIIATGSSSFDLLNKAGEPLTGRVIRMNLYPFAQMELQESESLLETVQYLDERLIFGSYPELFQLTAHAEKSAYLRQLVQSYLLKDILAFEGIRHSDKIVRLLRLIAYQVGNEVSFTELGSQLGMSKNTVESYMDLLSKVFIIYRLSSYSTNPRKEISKGSKWYFFDNGIRNAVINDFRSPALRNDLGVLWENYLLAERRKKNDYSGKLTEYYFWRNYSQQEIDLIEIENVQVSAYELKYSSSRKVKVPSAFANNYEFRTFDTISKENYFEWIA